MTLAETIASKKNAQTCVGTVTPAHSWLLALSWRHDTRTKRYGSNHPPTRIGTRLATATGLVR
jgi:hypothetical protein